MAQVRNPFVLAVIFVLVCCGLKLSLSRDMVCVVLKGVLHLDVVDVNVAVHDSIDCEG